MTSRKLFTLITVVTILSAALPAPSWSEGEVLEFTCTSCGYRQRFLQGADSDEAAHNVQHIIVVCERNRTIRNITIPLDPTRPVDNVPLLARQYGTGRSEVLGVRLPRFLVPGNTCPLFPVTAYLQQKICPVDGSPGFEVAVVGQY